MFFLALKLIKKFVKGMLWLVKLPIRITMKLAGVANSGDSSSSSGSRTNTKTRTATTEAARTGTAQSQSTGTATTDRQQAAAATTSAAAAGGAAATVAAASLSKYQRFRQSILAFAGLYVLTIGWLLVDANLLRYGLGGQFLIGGLTNCVVPAGLWYWTRQRSKAAWGVTMGYAVVMLLLSLATTTAFTVAVPNGGVFNARPILALLQIASLAALGGALFFGATGRDAVGHPIAVAPETTETAGGAGASTAASDTSSAAGGTTQQSSSVSESTTSGGTASQSDESRTTSTASSADDAPAAAAAASATGDDTAEASASDTTERSESAAATADANTTTEEPATPATEDEVHEDSDAATDEASDEIDPLLDDLWAEPAEPETVRELGETLSTTDPSEEVVETLERCSRADDPEVRVAVCDVCADLDGPEPESILQRLRIDTNDRVATTAMDAL